MRLFAASVLAVAVFAAGAAFAQNDNTVGGSAQVGPAGAGAQAGPNGAGAGANVGPVGAGAHAGDGDVGGGGHVGGIVGGGAHVGNGVGAGVNVLGVNVGFNIGGHRVCHGGWYWHNHHHYCHRW